MLLDILFLVIIVSFSHAVMVRGVFHYFKLVQLWPKSYCKLNGCARKPNNFTIHGLWPDNFTKPAVQKCTGPNILYKPQPRNFIPWLDARWTNLWARSTSDRRIEDFWKYQWEQHGTCTDMAQHDYFKLAGNLKDIVYILRILQQAGIRPRSKLVSVNRVSQLIASQTHQDPNVRCKPDHGGNLMLYEIVICFSPDGVLLINCPKPLMRSCAPYVRFPT